MKEYIAVSVALFGGLVTMIGWVVSNALGRRREAETRRIQTALRHLERQIEEFYGPLFSLVTQIEMTWQTREYIVRGGAMSDSDRGRVVQFFQERYFLPLHHQIRDIIKTKLYLVDGDRLPQSFDQYVLHATQQICQHETWQHLRVSTEGARYVGYPPDFSVEVRKQLDALMIEYERHLRALTVPQRPTRWLRARRDG